MADALDEMKAEVMARRRADGRWLDAVAALEVARDSCAGFGCEVALEPEGDALVLRVRLPGAGGA